MLAAATSVTGAMPDATRSAASGARTGEEWAARVTGGTGTTDHGGITIDG
jgi:hypothetical protein